MDTDTRSESQYQWNICARPDAVAAMFATLGSSDATAGTSIPKDVRPI
jgi:hypothetical protein